jgi:HEAT repeat protein
VTESAKTKFLAAARKGEGLNPEENKTTRAGVIDALEEAGDSAVILELEALLDSPDEEIRDAAEFAIDFLRS